MVTMFVLIVLWHHDPKLDSSGWQHKLRIRETFIDYNFKRVQVYRSLPVETSSSASETKKFCPQAQRRVISPQSMQCSISSMKLSRDCAPVDCKIRDIYFGYILKDDCSPISKKKGTFY